MDQCRWSMPLLQYRTRLWVCFFVMLILGAIYANWFLIPNEAFCEKVEVHERISELLIREDGQHYFVYVLNYRLLQAAIMLVMLKVLGVRCFLTMVTAMIGYVYGVLIAVESASLGAIGIVYGLIVWFPQVLFYAGIFGILYRMGHITYYNRKQIFMHVIGITILLLAGCLTEAFCNPKLMYYCNQYMMPVTKL